MAHIDKTADHMSEAELADYYYQHRNDIEGEVVPVTVAPRLDVTTSFRMTPEEYRIIRDAADTAGMKLSLFIRQTLLATARNGPLIDLDRARHDIAQAEQILADAQHALANS